MCMLLGFSGKKQYDIKEILRTFFEHGSRHPHGWGVAVYSDNDPMLIKEPVPANKSIFARKFTESSIIGRLAIAHIRYATFGNMSYVNTHPFIERIKGEDWVLAHNGSVDSPHLRQLVREPLGDTDSEKVFCFLGDLLDEIPLKAEIRDKIYCIEKGIKLLARHGKLNLLITDGSHLFVHTNCTDTLYQCEAKEAVCFSTKPIISRMEWEKVEMNRLFVYKDGKKIYEGTPHHYTYVQTSRSLDAGVV